MNIYVEPTGRLILVGDPPSELSMMGEAKRERASSILPVGTTKRLCFLFLRLCFGERGRIAEWTRTWQGPWTSRIFQTGETFTHQSRRVCLEWEHGKIEAILESSACDHNEMVANDDPAHAWKCAKCGYNYR